VTSVTPLPFVWPWWVPYWAAYVWAFWPEYLILRSSRKPATGADSPDSGSLRVILLGMSVAMIACFPIAWVRSLRFPPALDVPVFVIGVATLIAGSLLRRHCWRVLGTSFTGDVRVRPGQGVVSTGAYRFLRHPSYTAGILMNVGVGLSLGTWGGTVLLAFVSFMVYRYRMAVEERALLAVLGEPYRDFLRDRKRLIPFVY
jgi:protein-S-isoprenylcysteine O-methyltransferase Ste14